MGYYTKFELEIETPKMSAAAAVRANETLRQEIIANSNYSELFDGESIKWYDHEEEMLKISKENPRFLFILKGIGEEAGDIWVKYFKGGKVQKEKAKITFAEFDPAKLTTSTKKKAR